MYRLSARTPIELGILSGAVILTGLLGVAVELLRPGAATGYAGTILTILGLLTLFCSRFYQIVRLSPEMLDVKKLCLRSPGLHTRTKIFSDEIKRFETRDEAFYRSGQRFAHEHSIVIWAGSEEITIHTAFLKTKDVAILSKWLDDHLKKNAGRANR